MATGRAKVPRSLALALTPAQVQRALLGRHEWTPEARDTLEYLHRRAREETASSVEGAHPVAGADRGSWRQLELRIFGDPRRHIEADSGDGPGFGASLMNGVGVCLFELAGVVATDRMRDAVWSSCNWTNVLDACPAAFCFEVGESDEVPGMSDAYFWVAVDDGYELARQLRAFFVECVLKSA